jgi:hypothetical protein
MADELQAALPIKLLCLRLSGHTEANANDLSEGILSKSGFETRT